MFFRQPRPVLTAPLQTHLTHCPDCKEAALNGARARNEDVTQIHDNRYEHPLAPE